MIVWGDTRDMQVEVADRETATEEWETEGVVVTEPYALSIESSNGGVIIEGTESQLIKWVDNLRKIVYEELGEEL